MIYARYSTEEQDVSSITDQIAYCRDYLETIGYADAEITSFSDEGVSGERRNRPGIDHIWHGIEQPEWDLLICEDCSRLFRNESACMELAEIAFDNGMRIICINDDVDTEKDEWEERLREAAGHHARANHFLRRRIRRRLVALWRMGAAVSMLRPGYKRTPTVPASFGEPAKGPFFDAIDETWAPIVAGAYERIAELDPSWLVAQWLTESKLPKYENSLTDVWSAAEVIDMIRRSIYRGVDEHRKKIVKQKRRSGKKSMQWNPGERWQRPMEHLRIVSDALWHRANAAIDNRNRRKDTPRGADHALYGVGRDSRGPLSESFVCGVKGHKMHIDGRKEGGYRCSLARKGECWNKATALCEFTHAAIGRAVGEKLLLLSDAIDPFVDFVQQLYQSDECRQRRLAELNAEQRTLEQQEGRLLRLARSKDDPPASLVDDLQTVEDRLRVVRAEVEDQLHRAREQQPEVTRERILAELQLQTQRLLTMDCEAGVSLKRLIPGKIRAVPYQQFGTNQVVLRAEFELHLVKLLPADLLAALEGAPLPSADWAQPIAMSINLFKQQDVPANALLAAELRPYLTQKEIATLLGISKRQADLAAQLGDKMRAAGLTDPYVRLTSRPAAASRWRTPLRFQTVDRYDKAPLDCATGETAVSHPHSLDDDTDLTDQFVT